MLRVQRCLGQGFAILVHFKMTSPIDIHGRFSDGKVELLVTEELYHVLHLLAFQIMALLASSCDAKHTF